MCHKYGVKLTIDTELQTKQNKQTILQYFHTSRVMRKCVQCACAVRSLSLSYSWRISALRTYLFNETFTTKKWKFSDEKFRYISYFWSKHRLLVLVRTASTRRFWRVPTIYVFEQNKKNNVYPRKPQFFYIKVGFKGLKLYRDVFVMGY